MREIKFRDYAFEAKAMRYFTLDQYDKNEHDCYGNIMQYTGLNDKNNKEIYEGDILKRKIGLINPDAYHISFVIWYGHEWRTSNEIPCAQCSCNHRTPTRRNIKDFTQSEVIGNIYENPELLNK